MFAPRALDSPCFSTLGKGSNNQNGNLRWIFPLGVWPRPRPNGHNFQIFFYPTFFFCNWILNIWNRFYTSKISRLCPLIIGSKLTFISSFGAWSNETPPPLTHETELLVLIVWKYCLAFNVQSIIRKNYWIQNLFKDTEIQWQKTKCHLIALLPTHMHS